MAVALERPTIAELTLMVDADPWAAAGFRVERGVAHVGRQILRLAGRGEVPKIRWTLRGTSSLALDGLPTERSEDEPPPPAPPHPNGAEGLDHVVAFSPDLARTRHALEAAGLDFRRLREGPTPGGAQRQLFFRLGETILEVVEHPPGTTGAEDAGAPSRFYGLAFVTRDLDATATLLGDRLGSVRDAVQPGRRIATVRREAGLGLPVAFMTPG